MASSHACCCHTFGKSASNDHRAFPLQTQRQQLERAEAAHQRTAARLREVQASSSDASGGRLLELLQEEVAGLRAQVGQGA